MEPTRAEGTRRIHQLIEIVRLAREALRDITPSAGVGHGGETRRGDALARVRQIWHTAKYGNS
jgi:hypothetical protein